MACSEYADTHIDGFERAVSSDLFPLPLLLVFKEICHKFQAVERQLDVEGERRGAGTCVEFDEGESSISLYIPDAALSEEGWKRGGWQINAMNALVVSNSLMKYHSACYLISIFLDPENNVG